MPKSWYTISFCLSFLIAIALLQWWQLAAYPRKVWMILGGIGALCLYVLILQSFLPHVRMRILPLLFACILGVSGGFVRVMQTTHVTQENSVEAYAIGEKVTLKGIVAEEPDRRPMKTKYTIQASSVETPERASKNVHGKVLVTDHAMWPLHQYGDEVLVTGKLERPTQIEDFHYDRYLSRYGIYSVMYFSEIENLSSGAGHPFFSGLFRFKHRFESQINRLYSEPHASFLAGLLTGSRRGIPEHLLTDFRSTGLTHIIAISGYNITIVMGFIAGLLFFLPRRLRLIPSLLAITAFTFFVGASPSVVRAAIMGSLGLLALQSGRQRHSFIAILFAAMLMVAWNPKMLCYDAGFQLSFLAVLGLSYLAPFMEKWFRSVPWFIGEPLQMTIAAQLAAVPLIVILFGEFSLVAPLANMLVAFLIPAAMLFGFLGVTISFLSFPLGQFIAFIGWGALELIILVAENLSTVPYALISVPDMSRWWIGLYYIVMVTIVLFFQRREKLH